MLQTLAHVTFLVRDYEEALTFFTAALAFRVVEDTPLAGDRRWLLVAPPHPNATALLLAKAANSEQAQCVGKQAAGRVFLLFLHNDDFWRDYREMQARGVKFLESPRQETYGTVAVFEDLYGNKWDLLQPNSAASPSSKSPRRNPLTPRLPRRSLFFHVSLFRQSLASPHSRLDLRLLPLYVLFPRWAAGLGRLALTLSSPASPSPQFRL